MEAKRESKMKFEDIFSNFGKKVPDEKSEEENKKIINIFKKKSFREFKERY